MVRHIHPGDVVLYRKQKRSVRPGPHARDIWPAENGDTYSYSVDKFWRVVDVRPDGSLLVRTKTGKQHVILADDPSIRRIHWWNWLFSRHRFPKLQAEA